MAVELRARWRQPPYGPNFSWPPIDAAAAPGPIQTQVRATLPRPDPVSGGGGAGPARVLVRGATGGRHGAPAHALLHLRLGRCQPFLLEVPGV
ncbi:hypothetical protein C2845_PM17G09570 [Panicum miliaceum]|uniref:Uncharacterized protein n=1 Tax=Panicum miliaceum TaxID=4540 RepID=A0A3L6Q1N4_PANMI|nr:hypothetical protein C2845_PM17G09570 [Panicum miliaceum]